jgi:type VI secretion system protein ImpH
LSTPALKFPASEIVKLDRLTDGDQEADNPRRPRPLQMEVAFWGLIGPVGVLPSHYTQLVIDRLRHRDDGLYDFLGLFAHRQLSLFYRAWEKHYVAAGFEVGQRQQPSDDLLREILLSLVGRGTGRVRDQLEVLDDVCIYYGGLFIDRPNAESLGLMLDDFLGQPTRVLSLFGSWLRLPESEQSRLGHAHARLGVDTVIGERIWDPASKFRIRVGPVGYHEFQQLMPTGKNLRPICQLVRSYVGCEYMFDLQVILASGEIPACTIGHSQSGDANANLGWNTWLCSYTPQQDSDDAVFHHDGAPSGTVAF